MYKISYRISAYFEIALGSPPDGCTCTNTRGFPPSCGYHDQTTFLWCYVTTANTCTGTVQGNGGTWVKCEATGGWKNHFLT